MARQKRIPCPETDAIGEKVGKTILRLRTAEKLSLGDLSQISGVAKSMISQIERNETNPTLGTLSRISTALGVNIENVLSNPELAPPLVQKSSIQDTPLIKSEDGLCELRIIGWIESVEWAQWYDFKAKPGGKLESSAHPAGTVENLTILSGSLNVSVAGETWAVNQGETLRYRADRDHFIENVTDKAAHATMVNILAHFKRNS